MTSVYIIRAIGVGKIKVGVSGDVPRRLEELRAASPVPLEVVDVLLAADFQMEATLHALLRLHHSHGEWFEEEGALPIALRHFTVVRAASRKVVELIASSIPLGDLQAVIEMFLAAGAANIANELTNITGQSIMDRRYA